jgi:hypothetical protein
MVTILQQPALAAGPAAAEGGKLLLLDLLPLLASGCV